MSLRSPPDLHVEVVCIPTTTFQTFCKPKIKPSLKRFLLDSRAENQISGGFCPYSQSGQKDCSFCFLFSTKYMRAHLPSFQVDFLIIQADSLELQACDVFLNKIASDFKMALGAQAEL
jgi:hypothetical protein